MSSPPTEYLRHKLVEADYIVGCSTNLESDEFLASDTLKRAVVRSIEIIGEATKHISDDFRAEHSEFEWRAMAGVRDRLIHGYFGVDHELVWDVAVNKIPMLRQQLIKLLSEISS
jgi:uncharacterized protein with HEPN domain